MVAPAKAPPSLLAEAKKDCGHWAAIVSRQKREGGASWQESGLYMARWTGGREGGTGDTRPYRLAIRQLRRVM
jgi:hypothetical protein